jgi:hypothetical protein
VELKSRIKEVARIQAAYNKRLSEYVSRPSLFEQFIADNIPVKKVAVEGCDHIIGHYSILYDGGDIVKLSGKEDLEWLDDDFEPFKFCPSCGELNQAPKNAYSSTDTEAKPSE